MNRRIFAIILVSYGPTDIGILQQQGTDIIWEVEP